MTPQKPYLIRAIYEWLQDNQITPYLLVNAKVEGTQVPREYINDGKIVLNIARDAVRNFHADNEWISFSARFSGKPMELFIPITAVLAIYGKENNEGMFFTEDDQPAPPSPPKQFGSTKRNSIGLKVVK
ncbi:MAG: ClpXP protease specificity-enhancing factor [Gammaproteobacteria bacterium]|nr:ClpXP protease specificity-enhancing factor [Gammaproteobacteria bacterium]